MRTRFNSSTFIRRAMRPLVALAAASAAAALGAAPAAAVVAHLPGPDIGYQPLNGQGRAGPAPSAPTQFDSLGHLEYHGGPVMHSMAQYAIFWAPSGFAFPAGYRQAAIQYLKDVAADSGKPTNVYSVGTQFSDAASPSNPDPNPGPATYEASYGGSFGDATPYPSNGCPPYLPRGGSPPTPFTICLTGAQIGTEVDSVVSQHGAPRGLGTEYFVFLPDGVGNCFNATGTNCFDREFCAYHSFTNTGGTTLWANESFTPRDPNGCGTGEYPNGTANGKIDDQLSSLSHEANETITDPRLTGWFNTSNGQENGDECRGTTDDYGPPLGGAPGSHYNQVINGHHYILQREWSNFVTGCEQRYGLTASATGDTSGRVGDPLAFGASGTDGDGGTISSVRWSFGDGTSATGANPTHAFSAAGTFHPVAAVTNSTGLTASAAAPAVTIEAPPNDFTIGAPIPNRSRGTAKLPVTVPGPGTLALGGRGVVPVHAKSSKDIGAGTTKLTVRTAGHARRRLRRHGSATVHPTVTYTPSGGRARTKFKRVRLVRH